jgi:hypothetical protein
MSLRALTLAVVAALLAFSAVPAFASKGVVELTDDTYNSAVRSKSPWLHLDHEDRAHTRAPRRVLLVTCHTISDSTLGGVDLCRSAPTGGPSEKRIICSISGTGRPCLFCCRLGIAMRCDAVHKAPCRSHAHRLGRERL